MPPHGERSHAKYAASAAYRWLVCHGSIKLIGKAPKRDSSPWAQDGTEAHELLEYCLRFSYRNALEALLVVSEYRTQTYRADSEQERLDSVQVALDYVYEILDTYDDARLILEHQATWPTNKECGGTNDIIIVVKSLGLMWVIDFKHGSGVAVEVEENKQMLIYGVMAYDGLDGAPTMTLVIIQPRAVHARGPIREWIVPPGRLDRFVPEVDKAIALCEREDAVLVPGAAQCRWCEAATICPAIEKKALEAINVNFASVQMVTADLLPKPNDQPADRLAYILAAQELVETWFAECYAHAMELAKAGYTIPGYKLVEADAKRKYVGDAAETAEKIMLATGAEFDEVMPRKLIGITAAEKMYVEAFKSLAGPGEIRKAAKAAGEAFAQLTVKDTTGALSLVPLSNRRQAVTVVSQFGTVALPPPGKT